MINFNLTRKHKRVEVGLQLKGRIYNDSIIEISPIKMEQGDTLEVTYNVDIVGMTNGAETSRITESYKYHIDVKQTMTVRYIRFTKKRDDANIELYDVEPSIFYVPKSFNAIKI